MTKWTRAITVLLSTQLLHAQEPQLTGNWRIEQQRMRFSGDESSRSFLTSFSEGLDIEIFSDHRFSAGPDIGRWIFSNDYLLAVQETNIDRLAINEQGDSFAFTTTDFTGNDSDFVRDSGFSIAVKRPTVNLTTTQVAGDWVLLRQSMEFSEVEVGGSTTSTLLEVNHTRSEVSLDINGTLRGETIIDTERPDNEETTFDGTWEMIDGEFSALVGGETTARPNLSSGADLILHTQEDRLEIDGETFFGTTMEAWVKRPESLSSEEVIGSWGLSGIITEIIPVTGTDSIELRDFEIQEARIEFQADGTGTISNLTGTGIPQRSSNQNFTWTLDAREILVSAGDGEFRFTMTEGKDFAVLLKSTLATDLREFNFFALSKLPNVPGFTADAANGSLDSTSGVSPEVALTIESVAGIPYQVEESENLTEWITRTPPVLGTGGEITSTLEAISTRNRFYRWKLLPLEKAP